VALTRTHVYVVRRHYTMPPRRGADVDDIRRIVESVKEWLRMSTQDIDQDLDERWRRDGYILVPGLIHATQANQLRTLAEPILSQWRQCNPETGEAGGGVDATVMRHLNHPEYFRQSGTSLVDLLQAVPAVLDVCTTILNAEPLFRCTSLFMNPQVNSQDGNWHRDSQFHHADEEEERQAIVGVGDLGRSVQLQIALVASDDVEVVPGSHLRWDTTAEYSLQPGDAVAFNPLALHRGRYHADKLRRTLMLTYTSSEHPRFDYFSDQPWFDDDGYLHGVDEHTWRFFSAFVERYGRDWRTKLAFPSNA
jgi:hypothetical protein